MKDSLKIFIYPLPILKIGWLNLKIPSLNKETIQLNWIQLDSIGWYQRNRALTPISY